MKPLLYKFGQWLVFLRCWRVPEAHLAIHENTHQSKWLTGLQIRIHHQSFVSTPPCHLTPRHSHLYSTLHPKENTQKCPKALSPIFPGKGMSFDSARCTHKVVRCTQGARHTGSPDTVLTLHWRGAYPACNALGKARGAQACEPKKASNLPNFHKWLSNLQRWP